MTVPKKGANVWPYPIDKNNLNPKTLNANISIIHSVYKKEPVQKLFPKNETFYFTILRNTSDQLSSVFTFYYIGYRVNMDNSPESMARYIDEYIARDKNPPLIYGASTKNPNFFDFGYGDQDLISDDEIQKAISEVEETFDFVMIKEMWETSILLLKKKLNLNFDDVVVFNANERIFKSKNISEELKDKINKFNKADYKMYNYFYNKLKRESDLIPKEDYEKLRQRKAFWEKICIEKREPQILYSNVKFLGYKLKDSIPTEYFETCSHMGMNEVNLINLYKKQL